MENRLVPGPESLLTRQQPTPPKNRPWNASQFTASDDRVRGGASQSYLTTAGDSGDSGASRAEFSGTLDITALGGAGFASQRTEDGFAGWDLSAYDTMLLDVARADAKNYTVTLKDEVLPRGPDGRDQSTVSWEYDFVVAADAAAADAGCHLVAIPFSDFRPTYRGRPKTDADPLDLKNIKRFSFMMRSFFGEQQGNFSIVFNSVSVEKREKARRSSLNSVVDTKLAHEGSGHKGSDQSTFGSWVARLCGLRR